MKAVVGWILRDDKSSIREYIAKGGNINATNVSGDTLLHLAVLCGSKEVVEMFLKAGVNTGTKNNLKLTPEELADKINKKDLVKIIQKYKENKYELKRRKF